MENTLSIQPVILAAGKGTRMNSALPKVLVGLKGKPLIQHLVDNLAAVGFSHEPVIVVGHKYELVQSYLGPKYLYAFQDGQFGTAHALAAAENKVTGDHVLVLYGDMPFIQAGTLADLIKRHLQNCAVFSMLTTTVPNFDNEYETFRGFGRILRDQNGNLLQIMEFVDATPAEQEIREVNPGIYLFDTDWLWQNLSRVPRNKHGEHYLTDLVEIAIKAGLPIVTAEVDPKQVFGINTPQQLAQAEKLG